MKKSIRWVLLGIIILVLLFMWDSTFFGLFGSEESSSPAAASAAGPREIPVNGIVLSPTYLEDKITITGSVRADEFVEIKSEVSGKIVKINFKEGTQVAKGQLLAKIKDDELQAQLKKLQYQQQLLRQTEKRQQQLLEKAAISQEEYDQALSQLNATEADIELIKAQIAKTNLRAPFAGRLGLRNISEGSYINSGEVITTLYRVDQVKIDFAVPGKYANRVKVGDRVQFRTETLDTLRNGEVYAVEPRIDENTRTLQVRAISDNKDAKLLPGQFASIRLILNSVDNALLVPTEAVIPELGGHKVFLSRGGKATEVRVETGLRTESKIEITQGLNPGDTVITTGILQIRPQSEVNVNLVN